MLYHDVMGDGAWWFSSDIYLNQSTWAIGSQCEFRSVLCESRGKMND
jgi:hypothetical protein